MTSAVGGGGREVPKSRQKEQNQLISVRDKEGKGSKIPKFCGRHIWNPPYGKWLLERDTLSPPLFITLQDNILIFG